jgi:hypothetical protein
MSKEFVVSVIALLVLFGAFEHFVLVEGYKDMVDGLLQSCPTPVVQE